MLDILIAGARLVDGTGNPWYRADVGILDGRIVQCGVVPDRAHQHLDGTGMVLCPGFIDVHTHADRLLERPQADNMLRQGITTVVSGNCGSSPLPVGDMLDKVDAARPSINYATLVGHGSIRQRIMGQADRQPTDREMTDMCRLVEQAMEEGAVGISTGLFYVPGAYAVVDELVEVSRPVAAAGGVYATHARSAGGKIPEAIEETAEISRRAGIAAEISHLKVLHRQGRTTADRAAEILGQIERLRDEGMDVTYDLHPYPATNTSLSAVALPPWVSRDGKRDERLRDPAERDRMRPEVEGNIAWIGGPDRITIAGFAADASLEGKTVADAARLRGTDPADTAMDLVLEGNPRCIFHALREEDVRLFLTGEFSMVASDGGVVPSPTGVVHPRNYGTFPRILREYVRENRWMTLEDAIRRMSWFPASRFRLAGRGLVAPNYAADLVLLDPDSVADQATFDAPHAFPTGIACVIVNGRIAWQAGSDDITRGCGMAIRK